MAGMVKIFTSERDRFLKKLRVKDEKIGLLEAENENKVDLIRAKILLCEKQDA